MYMKVCDVYMRGGACQQQQQQQQQQSHTSQRLTQLTYGQCLI